MSVTINTIPNDIIMDIIVLNLDFSDVSKLALSSRYYNNNKEIIYNTIIKNDKFLKDININILKTIEESSFSLKLFFELYDNIKNDKTINLSIPFINVRNRELTKERIDATFKLYRILMSFAIKIYKFQFRNKISTHMIKYFNSVYKYRHPKIKDSSKKLFFNLITHRDELQWHISNINIYYLYENGNLIESAIRSYELKNNLNNFDDGIIDNNYENAIHTIAFLIKMFEHLKIVEIRIYYLYKIFKYIIILKSNKNFNFKNENFMKIVKNKTIRFKYEIENIYTSKFSHNIRKKMVLIADELNIMC